MIVRFIFLISIFIFNNGYSQTKSNKYCNDSKKIEELLISKGYLPLIEFDSIIGSYENENSYQYIEDDANLIVQKDSFKISIRHVIKSEVEKINIQASREVSKEINFRGYIGKNELFCDDMYLEAIQTDFSKKKNDGAIYAHIWKDDENNTGKLFVKYKSLSWESFIPEPEPSSVESLLRQSEVKEIEFKYKSNYTAKFDFYPLDQWKEGMTFLVKEFSCVKGPTSYIREYKTDGKRVDIKEFIGEKFVFKKHEKREVEKSNNRNTTRDFMVFESQNGIEYEYTPSTIVRNIIHLMYVDEIEVVRNDLMGKELVLLFSLDENGNRVNDSKKGAIKKFSKVVVDSIGYGVQDAPIRIWFKPASKDNNQKFSQCVGFSGINNKKLCSNTYHFDEVFMFESPLDIHKDNIQIIEQLKKGKLEVGMTKNLARLIKGHPKSLVEVTKDNMRYEVWNYRNRGLRFVLFHNDIIIKIEE